MKRITSLLLALVFVLALLPAVTAPAEAAGDVTINATNFPDETFRNYVKNNFDTDANGVLSSTEIASAVEIRMPYYYSITSLKGVEYFTALEMLIVQGNLLTELDLSKNTTLERLQCSDNKLTSLDLSKNTALLGVTCSYNQLTSLILPKNTELNGINCQGNQLTDLDIRDCPGLIEVYTNGSKSEQKGYNDVMFWRYFYYGLVIDVDQSTEVVTEITKPTINTQPASQSAKVGDSVNFTVAATGGFLTYRWQYRTSSTDSWKNSGATGCNTRTLTISAATSRNGYQYRCVVENEMGKAISNAATLTVTAAAKPTITTQPTDKSAKVGETVKFTVKAEGVNITYRWQYRTGSTGTWKNSTLTGHATATLTVAATAARNGYQYRCVVEDANGNKAISNGATLTIKPAITTQPKSATATAGTAVKFTVKATGAGLTYQWQYRTSSTGTWKNSGATGYKTATLTVTPTAGMNGYQYRCVIVDANGAKLISTAATLTVTK